MGAQQSSGRNEFQDNALVKRDYYEVLGIERAATEDDIKKAYRRKALELHPDRNYGNVEAATAAFAEVQSAYEVLSDPQERSWYDSHRESILRGDAGSAEDDFQHDIRLTSAGDIVNLISKFNRNVPFTDEPTGFYGILRETFASLAREEDAAADWEGLEAVDYPDFGESRDEYEDTVKGFYRTWINFTTKKTFSWRDAYRASDAPDRATRRLVEKENKRLREEGIREFNDAVRHLVSFVRKRDPRYTPNSQSEAERQKILREVAAAQAARSRAENLAKLNSHVVPEWAQSHQAADNEGGFSDSDPEEVEHIECVVCGKTFKSEKQFETHEKSKKHIKAVQQLKWEIRLENEALNLESEAKAMTEVPNLGQLDIAHEKDSFKERKSPGDVKVKSESTSNRPATQHTVTDSKSAPRSVVEEEEEVEEGAASDTTSEDSDYTSRKQIESHIRSPLLDDPSEDNSSAAPKMGKAKLKRAKKQAKQQTTATLENEFRCAACAETFTSKTKLFTHIKELDHAQPLPSRGKNKKK